jgi:hypothetical protein
MVSDSLARELDAPVVAKTEVVTSAWSELHLVVRLASIAVAPSRVDDLLAPVLPDARLLEAGPGIRGVLGQDFLSGFNYTLDYERARLSWDEPMACDAPAAVPLAAVEGRFVMAVRDERGAALRLVPDSGADAVVLFSRQAPSSRSARLGGVRIGDVTLRSVQAAVVERADAGVDGLLPLHRFAAVSFAAGGGCLTVR